MSITTYNLSKISLKKIHIQCMNMNENKWTKEAITSPIVGKISNKYIWINLTENLNDIYKKANKTFLRSMKEKIWMNEKSTLLSWVWKKLVL